MVKRVEFKSFFKTIIILTIGFTCLAKGLFGQVASVKGYWDFRSLKQDSLLDQSPFANHGKIYNVIATDSGLLFNGKDSRIILRDTPSLQLTKSISIEAWVFVMGFSLPKGGSHHGFILFRGDDRSAKDAYFFSTEPQGTIRFHIESEQGPADISSPITKNTWLHLVGTLNDSNGQMCLYVNGKKIKDTTVNTRPNVELSKKDFAGVGIGNHAGYPLTEKYKFPFHGILRELRILDSAMSEKEVNARWIQRKE